MKQTLFIAALCVLSFISYDAMAQLLVPEEGAVERLVPNSANGRIAANQVEPIALAKVPGELLSTRIRQDEDRYYHQFKILSADKSVYVVEINAATAQINKIYINQLSENPVLPMDVVSMEIAETFALEHVREETPGLRKPKLRSSVLGVRFQNPVYLLEIKKAASVYDVIVDASDGSIISVDRQ